MSSTPEGANPRRQPAIARPRPKISDGDLRKFERYVAEIFMAFGLDIKTPGTEATPRRFIRALLDSTEGYDGDPKLLTAFGTECRGGKNCELNQIVEGPIPFFALCEHHVFPFYGQVYVGYIAHEEIIGLSKLTRLVRLFARRFTVQERIGEQVVGTLESLLAPHGVAVVLEAHHLCTQMRGVRESGPSTRTTFWRGHYTEDAALRSEFLTLCGARE
ncbi:MAG: GTP cyclohydrolase I [Candidatus Thermoplasmatota archaeon]|nr:GTP cyclohydrolase I [Candidatus Thermoplasmatota archaeon]